MSTTLSRPGSGRPIDSKVRRPMIIGLPQVQRLEALQIAREPPGQAVVDADDAIASRAATTATSLGCHAPHTAIGAAIAGQES